MCSKQMNECVSVCVHVLLVHSYVRSSVRPFVHVYMLFGSGQINRLTWEASAMDILRDLCYFEREYPLEAVGGGYFVNKQKMTAIKMMVMMMMIIMMMMTTTTTKTICSHDKH